MSTWPVKATSTGSFTDCAHGAVPAIGECYGLDVIVDETIDKQPEIYFEGGDHTTLVRMTRPNSRG